MNLDFSPAAYRDAVALISAHSFGDVATCEVLLEDAGRDLACALVVVVDAAIRLLAELGEGPSYGEMLEVLGSVAARVAAGMDPA